MQIRFNKTVTVDRVRYEAGDELDSAEITPGHLASLLGAGDAADIEAELKARRAKAKADAEEARKAEADAKRAKPPAPTISGAKPPAVQTSSQTPGASVAAGEKTEDPAAKN